jgi:hypothetical protein
MIRNHLFTPSILKLSQSILKDLWGRVSVAGRVVFYDRAFDEIRRYYHVRYVNDSIHFVYYCTKFVGAVALQPAQACPSEAKALVSQLDTRDSFSMRISISHLFLFSVPIPRDAEAEVRSGLVSVKKGHLDRMRSYPTTYACFAKYVS